ncbi:hypothetical protein [Spiroplasma tabanidicola]|uniref:Uncharacterized protein n=1 Tax=Spiroplasma tabanidicola TaxID=324079 RepID=A0A6I6C7M6_9MOLU|nr:hypothetical protein [Spiroplasma tabanidicola]QGS51796.1 hypothetical protein STABA_v1c04330 [Spiroplasma tabanidicola]
MAKELKTSEKDFNLISDKTKTRIKGLMEKRLTTQTVALFAQEYETYDFDIRSEIIDFIVFLLDKAQQELEDNDSRRKDEWDQRAFERRRLDFIEKQTKVKTIQAALKTDHSILNKFDFSSQQSKVEEKKPIKSVKQTNVKTINLEKQNTSVDSNKKLKKETIASSIEKRIREAALREQKEAAAEKARLEKEKKEAAELKAKLEKEKKEAAELKFRKEKEKKAVEEKARKEKEKKEAEEKKKVDAEKKAKNNLKAQSNSVFKPKEEKEKEKVDKKPAVLTQRDYEKEQAEKEKLWKELYGKSRVQTQEAKRPSTSSFAPSPKNTDKTPLIKEESFVNFRLYGHTYPIDELTDPKHKLYVFWNTIKNKYKSGNISVWLKEQSKFKNWWIYKKRLKAAKKANKMQTNNAISKLNNNDINQKKFNNNIKLQENTKDNNVE